MTFLLIILLNLVTLIGSAPARAQKTETVQEEILYLQRTVADLQYKLAKGDKDAAGNPATARLNIRLDALESTLRQLTGQLEQSLFRLRQLEQRVTTLDERVSVSKKSTNAAFTQMAENMQLLNKGNSERVTIVQPKKQEGGNRPPTISVPPIEISTDVNIASEIQPQVNQNSEVKDPEDRTQNKKAGLIAFPGETASVETAALQQTDSIDPADLLPKGTIQEQYDHSFQLLRQGNYSAAARALVAFLQLHPESELAPNAMYWLGETHYVRNNYNEAVDIFSDTFRKFPNGPKAPDSLLKMGMSLNNLGERADACTTFQEMVRRFPNVPSNIRLLVERERQKANCG